MTTNKCWFHNFVRYLQRVAVVSEFQSVYGFEPSAVYCSITGKPIGRTDEFCDLIDSLRGDASDVADDIAVRIFASMRPSLFWNKMREDSLETLRKSRPTETLAYLLNRLFAPKRGADMLAVNHDRIRLWQKLEEWGVNDSTNTLTYYLLEIDAKLNLSELSAPFTVEDFLTRFDTMPLLLEKVQAWYLAQLDEYSRLLKRNELNTRWWRSGHALAKPAFFAAWQESTPPSPTAMKATAKREEKDFFAGLLFGILKDTPVDPMAVITEAQQEAAKPKPIRVPVTKMPMTFGVKKVEG